MKKSKEAAFQFQFQFQSRSLKPFMLLLVTNTGEMLEYELGNQSSMMLSGDEPTPQEQQQNRQLFDHYAAADQSFDEHNLIIPQPTTASSLFHFHHPITTHHQVNSFFNQRGYASTSTTTTTAAAPHPSLLSFDPAAANAGIEASYFLAPKAEDVDFTARIGLNLGGRTYFSSAEDDFVNQLYRGSRPMEAAGSSSNVPRCQVEGCNADLTHAKHYHRRHKVCDFHSKASTVIVSGLTQRFCQQCSRFHLLREFDNGKRSCRRRLADHNRRRRKSHQTNQESQKSQLLESAPNSSPENLTRSPQDSGAQPSSSVTVAISRPRMSLDCFKPRPCQANASSSSAPSSSLFFSGG